MDQSMRSVEKFKFKQYDISEFENIQSLNNSTLFILQSAQLIATEQPVFLLTFKYFNKDTNYIYDTIKSSSSFLKIRWKYIIEKMGYIYNNKKFTVVYERPDGEILEFTSADTYKNSEEVKLFVIEKILEILKRIKEKANHQFGYITPSMFIFNTFSDKPIMLIEHSFLIIHGKIYDPMMKLLFGYFKHSQYPNDFAMILIFITKFFLEVTDNMENVQIEYEVLIYRFYLYIIDKKSESKFSFKYLIDNHIKNEGIKKLIQEYTEKIKVMINSNQNKPENEKQLFNEFYKGFISFKDNNIHSKKCINCNLQADKPSDICFEILCKKCEVNHMCSKKILFTIRNKSLQTITNKQTIKDLESHYSIFSNIHNFDFSQTTKSILNKFNNVYNKHEDILNITKTYIDELVNMLKSNIKFGFNLIDKKNSFLIKRLENLRVNNSDEDEIKATLLSIKKIIEIIEDSNNMMRKLDNSDFFNNLTDVPENYYIVLEHFRVHVLKPLFDDFFINLKYYLIGEKGIVKHKYSFILDGIMQKKVKIDIFTPIYKTDAVLKYYDISPNCHSYNKQEYRVIFEVDDEIIDYFPDKSKYIRFSTFILITGGLLTPEDDKYIPCNKNFILDIENMKVYIREPMHKARFNHSLCKFNRIYLIAVGGNNNGSCEMYSITKNEWIDLPSLVQSRENSNLMLVDKTQLYCFGGVYNNIYIDSIEFLELPNGAHWTQVKLSKTSLKVPFIQVGTRRIPERKNSFLIIGGKMGELWNDTVYEFNIQNLEISKTNESTKKCIFLENQFTKYNKKYIQIAFDQEECEFIVKVDI